MYSVSAHGLSYSLVVTNALPLHLYDSVDVLLKIKINEGKSIMSKSINRREFLGHSALMAAAASMPLNVFAQDKMHERVIPGTNETLPLVGLGAPDIFISETDAGRELPKSIIQAMIDSGGRFIDTPAFLRPDVPIMGDLLTEMGIQNDLFLASKITVDGKQEGIDHLEKLLPSFNKKPIDLLLVHNMRDLENHWPTVQDYQQRGWARYTGVSLTRQTDFTQLEQFMKTEKPNFIMTGYSITQQGPAERVLPLAQDLGIAVIGVEPFKAFDDGAFFSMVAGKELPAWAADYNITSWAQFSLKWILSNPAMTSVVTETSKVKHVIDNMGAGFGDLPDEKTRKMMSDLLLSFA